MSYRLFSLELLYARFLSHIYLRGSSKLHLRCDTLTAEVFCRSDGVATSIAQVATIDL